MPSPRKCMKITKNINFYREGFDFAENQQNGILLCRNWFCHDFSRFFDKILKFSAFSRTSSLKIDFVRFWKIRALHLKPESCVLLRFSDFFQILSSFCSSPTLVKLFFSRFCKFGELHFKCKSCVLLRFSCVWVAFVTGKLRFVYLVKRNIQLIYFFLSNIQNATFP